MEPVNRKTESNGRRPDGKFGPGNRCAANNRRGHLMQLRKALIDCITVDDIADVVAAILTAAKNSDIAAAKLLFDRIYGRVGADVVVDEDTEPMTDEEKRAELLNRFSRLSPEQQSIVRTKLKKPAEQST